MSRDKAATPQPASDKRQHGESSPQAGTDPRRPGQPARRRPIPRAELPRRGCPATAKPHPAHSQKRQGTDTRIAPSRCRSSSTRPCRSPACSTRNRVDLVVFVRLDRQWPAQSWWSTTHPDRESPPGSVSRSQSRLSLIARNSTTSGHRSILRNNGPHRRGQRPSGAVSIAYG